MDSGKIYFGVVEPAQITGVEAWDNMRLTRAPEERDGKEQRGTSCEKNKDSKSSAWRIRGSEWQDGRK